ncbi:MAG: RNA 2'-phosphotransferase [Pirellulales bacterium]
MTVNEKETRRISKFLSLVLRHQPETIGITLDDAGWTSVEELLTAMQLHRQAITREILDHVVASNDKQRFAFSQDGLMIRARQGHSVEVELGYESAQPPEFLLHGTPTAAVESIRREGLKKMKRHHVHMHSDESTAKSVGARRGSPVILRICAQKMASEGFEFFVTANDVWLTDHVPARFIEFP